MASSQKEINGNFICGKLDTHLQRVLYANLYKVDKNQKFPGKEDLKMSSLLLTDSDYKMLARPKPDSLVMFRIVSIDTLAAFYGFSFFVGYMYP